MKSSRRLFWVLLFAVAALAFRRLSEIACLASRLPGGVRVWDFISLGAVAMGTYQVVAILIAWRVNRRKGPDGEIQMLTSFARAVTGLAIVIALFYGLGVLKTIGVMAAGFAGMLLGWSLQAPVSGIAAWVLVTLMRPFRVSDRVLFPSLGLTGDVKRVGLMYTVLDQVGGAVGSEEAIGRDVLIPNAMLFSQVAINYTPTTVTAYFLDEVVVRLTYDSDWNVAERLLLDAARTVTAEVIKATGQDPYIRSDIWDYGVLMRLRYMTMAKDRPRITHEIVKHIFQTIQANPRVDMAIPFVYSYRKGSGNVQRHQFPDPEGQVHEILISEIDDSVTDASALLTAEDEQQIQRLMKNIQDKGLLQPIVITPSVEGRYNVVAGHQRIVACQRLGWKTIPALVRP